MKKFLRPALAAVILIVTAVLFVRFFMAHPQYLTALKHTSPWTIFWVLLLNAAMIVVITGIVAVSVIMCGKRTGFKENFFLSAYSSLLNFFGPLQSGPGLRAAYLKTKHNVRLRDYTLATLLSISLFALFSALFLLIGTRPWWQTVLALAAVSVVCWGVTQFFRRRDKNPGESKFTLSRNMLAAMIGLVFLQMLLTIGWYYVELHAVNPQITLLQAMSYAGAANFAAFVAFTPDAVGIREAFLIFSQHIHHVPTADIVKANVIDRAVYILFLGLLFVVVLLLHAKDKLQIKKP